MTRTVPFPLHVAETKIHPSCERVNANGLLDFEIEETSSSSETRLFSFLSPEKRISAYAAPANPQMRITNGAISLALITNGNCAAAQSHSNVANNSARNRNFVF